MPTKSELLALDYGTNPFGEGILAQDYADQFKGQRETVRVWECFPQAPDNATGPSGETVGRDGNLYIEKTVAPDALVLISSTTREVYDTEFGLLAKGETAIAVRPSQIELARYDRVLITSRQLLRREVLVAPSAKLSAPHAVAIASVVADGVALQNTAYSLQVDGDGTSRILWPGAAPQIAFVSYWFAPLYIFLDVSDRNPPTGADGERLLQRGILTLERGGVKDGN